MKTEFDPSVPSDYKLEEFLIYDAFGGNEQDIEPLVLAFTIESNLYLSTMILKARIYDATQFWRFFQFTGQEKVKIRFSTRRAIAVGEYHDSEVEVEFRISEIADFQRKEEDAAAVNYLLVGIEEHAYKSKLKKVSRFEEDELLPIIEKLIVKDLEYSGELNFGEQEVPFTGVLPWKTPLQHCDFLKKRIAMDKALPFFFSSLIDDVPHLTLKTLNELKDQGIYDEYIWTKEYVSQRYSDLDYREQQIRILNLNSQLGFKRFGQASKGAFAAEEFFYDIHDGTIKHKEFNYKEDGKIGNQIIPEPTINAGAEIPLEEKLQSQLRFFSINSGQNSRNSFIEKDNYSRLTQKMYANLKSHFEILNTTRHDFRLFGDINMQPGNIAILNFSSTGETRDKDKEPIDERISGKYLIVNTVHRFEHRKYFVNVTAVRESNPEVEPPDLEQF